MKARAPRRRDRSSSGRAGLTVAAALLAAAIAPRRALAWETTTHVGLAEQAGLAVGLDDMLRRLGWKGGMFEPLVIPPEDAPGLLDALALHTATDGYVPDLRGQQYALGWLLAGAALADSSLTWASNHFFDPATGLGWRRPTRGLADRLGRQVQGGGSLPARGVPAVDWVTSPDNPLGLDGFLDQYGKSVSAATPGERSRAMAGALVAAGAMAHVLADMASPGHVRGAPGDLNERVALATGERGARLERLAAIAFGRLGVPAPRTIVDAPDLRSFFVSAPAGDAGGSVGLASWTSGHWFSPATLPSPVPAGRLPRERLAAALTASLARPLPAVPARLSLVTAGQPEGATLRDENRVCLARYRVERGVLSWSLDDDCLLEQARALLPVAAGYQAGLLRWLFRGELAITAGDADAIAVRADRLALGAGTLTVLVEDGRGVRTVVATVAIERGATATELASATLPAGSRGAVAVFRGVDDRGAPLVAVGVFDRSRRSR